MVDAWWSLTACGVCMGRQAYLEEKYERMKKDNEEMKTRRENLEDEMVRLPCSMWQHKPGCRQTVDGAARLGLRGGLTPCRLLWICGWTGEAGPG